MEDVTQIATQVTELAYALDTFYFLVCGALVMWMAAGFTMLESGLVRAKNTAEILTKNVGLYSIACIMYMIVGYNKVYRCSNESTLGGIPPEAITDNTDWWSGDHCMAPDVVPGVFLANRPINTRAPRFHDITPTILQVFGIETPPDMTGIPILK